MTFTAADKLSHTNCKKCIFAIYNDKTQVDCKQSMLSVFKDKIIEAYDEDLEFYVIDGFCNRFRPEAWNNGDPDVELAKLESMTSFDILIEVDDINQELYEKIDKTLDNIDYNLDKLNIILFHGVSQHNNVKQYISQLVAKYKFLNISICVDRNEFIRSRLKTSYNVFHIVTQINKIDNISSFINQIEYACNHDMKKVILAQSDDYVAIFNAAYGIFYSNLYIGGCTIEQIIEDTKKYDVFLEVTYEEKNQAEK